MLHHGKENPFYARFDRLLEIARTLRRHPQPGRRPPARLHPRRHRPAPDRGAPDPRRARQAGPGSRRPGHGRGPGPRPARPGRDEHAPREARLRRRAVLRPRPAGHRHRPRLRPHRLGHRRRRRRGGRGRFPLLRHSGGAPRPAHGRRRPRGAHRLEDRRPRGRHRQGRPRGPRARPEPWPGPASASIGRRSGAWPSTPKKFAAVRKRRRSRSKACSMCGDFCAMKIVGEFLGSGRKADGDCS
ncbi:MAG: hypothetical protein MZV64_10855 [Ignavibacteriales bacterium]|nr:hypothetical protein [Ignavibacteriales bacterium]